MAKNYNAAFASMNSDSRKKRSADATNALLTGIPYDISLDKTPLPIETIELSKIKKRPVNRYHAIDNLELDESIRQYGLINPIAVCHKVGEDTYTISAGERRFDAITRLNQRYPDNPRFQKVECKVYILTEDTTLLEQGFPYITAEQEEGIYRDSNNLARQLTEKDIASQIRYIIKRFDDPAYVKQLKDTAELAGFTTYSNPDKTVLISSVMKSQGLWSREKIRQYLVIEKTKNEELLDAIEEGTISVNKAYKQVVEVNSRKRKRKTNKISPLNKAIDSLYLEAKTQDYSNEDLEKLEKCIQKLQEIYDDKKQK
jgi:hypothetical protein